MKARNTDNPSSSHLLEPDDEEFIESEPVHAEFIDESSTTEEVHNDSHIGSNVKSEMDLANEVKNSVLNLANRYASEGSIVKASVGVGLVEAFSFGLAHFQNQKLK